MTKLRFTKTALLALPLPAAGKRLAVYDTEVSKLAMRITAAGSRTFYVIKRAGASMAWVKLGTFPEMTIEQARGEAQKILAEFAAGANPATARRAIREEPTFLEMLLEMLQKKKKRDGTPIAERTKKDYLDTARLHMGSITNSKLSHILRSDVKSIHIKASKKSLRQADKAVAIISSVFNYATDLEHFRGTNPASRIQKNPAPSRDRFAQAAELPSLFSAISESNLRDYFLLSLLTGARRSNVQAMAWRDLDLDGGIWRLGVTKNGTPQNITLSPEAAGILRARKDALTASPFVFPGTGQSGHLVEPKKAWSTILRRASTRRLVMLLKSAGEINEEQCLQAEKLIIQAPAAAEKLYRGIASRLGIDPSSYDMTDLRIHDLRRTLGSWQAKTGASMAIIGKSLNHKTHQATAIYARLDLDPVRQSVNTATQAMLKAGGIRQSADVVSINRNQ